MKTETIAPPLAFTYFSLFAHTVSYECDVMKKRIYASAFHLIYLSVLAKALSFIVRILLARKLGNEAMNYYSITAPTMVFLISIVQQGIPSALSKLTAQHTQSKLPLLASALITAITTSLTILLYICLLPLLARQLLHDVKLIPVLQAILPLLPAVALSGLLKGYLQGIQHHYQANVTQFYEEAARILFLLFCFQFLTIQEPVALASLAMLSVAIGEWVSCFYMLFHLRFSFHHVCIFSRSLQMLSALQIKEILHISMPMMGSRISGSLTYFLEPICMLIFVPDAIREMIIQGYGTLNGYTLPLLTMPSFLSITLSNYLLPSFTYALAHHQKKQAKKSCLIILSSCLLLGFSYSLLCFFAHEQLFQLFYHNTSGSHQLRLLSIPFLFYSLQPPLSALLHASSLSVQAFCDTLIGSLFRLSCILFLTPFLQENALLLALGGGMLITTFLHALRLSLHYLRSTS